MRVPLFVWFFVAILLGMFVFLVFATAVKPPRLIVDAIFMMLVTGGAGFGFLAAAIRDAKRHDRV